MAKVELVNTNSSVDEVPSTAALPLPISFEIEAGGEAVFRIPTVKDLKRIEKHQGRISLTETCRELGRVCLINWGDRDQLPDEDSIDAVDDQLLVRLMLQQMTGAQDQELNEADLAALYLGQLEPQQRYTVLPDRTHRVTLSAGDLTLRRLTQKDIRRVEANADKVGAITGDVLTATSVTIGWWRSDRAIMPADFDSISLAEFRKVSEALQGFLKRSSNSERRTVS